MRTGNLTICFQLMDILDDIDEPEMGTSSSNFGGPGEYMMMDTDDIASSSTPELPRRTEESKQLLREATQETTDSVYCEPAPVWNSSPSSEWIVFHNLHNCSSWINRTSKNRR